MEVPLKLWGWHSRRRRVHVQCVEDILEIWPGEFLWSASIVLYHQQRRAERDRRRPAFWNLVLRRNFLGWKVKKSRRCSSCENREQGETVLMPWYGPVRDSQGETKMIRWVEMALYQSRESTDNEEERQKGFTENPYNRPHVGVNSAVFDSLKQIIFLYLSVVVFLYYTTIVNKKKKTCRIVDLAVPADH